MQHKLWVLGQAVNHEHLQKWYNSKQQLPLCMCCKIENSDVQGLPLLRKFNFPGNASNPYPITLVPYIFAAAVLIFRAATERSKIESNWRNRRATLGIMRIWRTREIETQATERAEWMRHLAAQFSLSRSKSSSYSDSRRRRLLRRRQHSFIL
jgi:hypothetical protein